MKLLSRILKNEKVASLLIRNIDLNVIRAHLGQNFLSSIQAFAFDGYHQKLYSDLPLNSDSTVVILGGYQGTSAKLLYAKYAANIYVVEPIPEYVEKLRNSLTDPKFTVLNFAISDSNGLIEIGIDGEESGIRATKQSRFLANGRKASELLTEISNNIDLLEMNIEGSEYLVLQELIETSVIQSIRCLLVQFHGTSIEDELSRSLLRQKLSETHVCIFNYPWVWERWDLRT